jgi:hypothetical protein
MGGLTDLCPLLADDLLAGRCLGLALLAPSAFRAGGAACTRYGGMAWRQHHRRGLSKQVPGYQ